MPQRMDIIKKLHQQFVIDKVKDLDWKESSDAPLVVELDTTEVCNLACPGCISEDLVAQRNSIGSQRLMDLGQEFYESGVKAVILIGGGEPLAHPKVGDFMQFLGEHDISIGITTNGCFIDRHLEVVSEYSNWTRISMDAATEETFFKLRPGKNGKLYFNKVVNNMKQLAKVKKGKLGFSYLIRTEADGFGIESNIKEIYDAAVLAKDIGCDYFEVKPSYNYDKGVDHSLVVHDKKRMDEAKEEISRLDTLETEVFSIIKAINLTYSLESVVEKLQPKDYSVCPMTELRTLICPSGVFACPYWRGKERFRIGDIKETTFDDMWHGERRKDVMTYLNPGKHCSFHCLRHESNLEVFKMKKELEILNSITPVPEYDRFI